jgi:hypothetical protein
MASTKDTAKAVIAEESEGAIERSRPSFELESWEDAIEGANVVLGRDLAKDELFDKLIGVPFLITRLHSYPGKGLYERADGAKVGRDFFAIEIRLAPERVMKERLVNVENLRPFEPDDLLVINDSSTGIRRQLVQYLWAVGAISLPEPITYQGALGESTFDLPVSEWTDVLKGGIRFDTSGRPIYEVDFKLDLGGNLIAKRGIRISEYHNDYTDEGKTRYLA